MAICCSNLKLADTGIKAGTQSGRMDDISCFWTMLVRMRASALLLISFPSLGQNSTEVGHWLDIELEEGTDWALVRIFKFVVMDI